MVGIELASGQHVFYFCAGANGIMMNEATIILVRDRSIRVEFLGPRHTNSKIVNFGKKKGGSK